MKIRWKQHELILVTTIVITEIVKVVFKLNGTQEEIQNAFIKNNLSFDYTTNLVIPQVNSIILILLIYLFTNYLILPQIKKLEAIDFEKILSLKTVKLILTIVLFSAATIIYINFINQYARPDLVNYGNYKFLALFGFRDHPITNYLISFERALLLISVLSVFLLIRDYFLNLISTGPKREYNTMASNYASSILLLLILFLYAQNPVHLSFLRYTAWLVPSYFLFLFLYFRFFPKFEKANLNSNIRILIEALLLFFLCQIIFHSILSYHFRINERLYFSLYLVIILPICTYFLFQQNKDRIQQLVKIEADLNTSEANVKQLLVQMNPHFMFNALNTLYATALSGDSEKTATGIQKLGDMMRFILHENNQEHISMDKELENLQNYISLQSIRISNNTNVEIDHNLDEVHCPKSIAPMLLLPFIENAFKHGISLTNKSWIIIELNCNENGIEFNVKNSIHKLENDPESNTSGIGLNNVRKRLELLYPNKHSLQVKEENNEFITKIMIQC